MCKVVNNSSIFKIHFVNWNTDVYENPESAAESSKHDGLAVLGVFIVIGAPNLEIEKILQKRENIQLKNQQTEIDSHFELKSLLPGKVKI